MWRKLVPTVALALGACSVSPSINYHVLTDQDYDDSWIPYQLTDTTLVIGVNLGASNQGGTSPGTGTDQNGQRNGSQTGGSKSGTKSLKSSQRTQTGQQSESRNSGTSTNSSADPGATANTALIQPLSHEELKPVSLTPKIVRCTGTSCYGDTISMAAVPISFEDQTFAIEPTRNWLIYTHLAPTYYENSLRLQTIGISVEDKRQEAFDTFGAIAVGSAKTFGSGGAARLGAPAETDKRPGQDLNLPIVIDLADAKKAQTQGQPLPNNLGWIYKLEFLDHPDAVGFKHRSAIADFHGSAVTALCRSVSVTLTSPDKTTILRLGVTVADPDYLLAIPIPPSGSVAFGALCGSNVTMVPTQAVRTDQLATSFFNDVQQIRNASHHAP